MHARVERPTLLLFVMLFCFTVWLQLAGGWCCCSAQRCGLCRYRVVFFFFGADLILCGISKGLITY